MCIVSNCINIHLVEADVYLNMNYTYIAAIISFDNFNDIALEMVHLWVIRWHLVRNIPNLRRPLVVIRHDTALALSYSSCHS